MSKRGFLLTPKGFATKIKESSLPSGKQLKDCGAKRECPNCHFLIDNSDVSHEWPGLPVGVKFDPSDLEIIEHLAAKCGVGEPHKFIDDFIPTLDAEGGICFKHPEELPGHYVWLSRQHFWVLSRRPFWVVRSATKSRCWVIELPSQVYNGSPNFEPFPEGGIWFRLLQI